MSLYVGLDIGGTKLLVASADEQGAILQRTQEPTPYALDEGLALLKTMIERVTNGQPITSIGVAIGGPLDCKSGIVSPLHQPQWRDVPLKQIMEAAYGCPLYVDVDTNVAALGEFTFGEESVNRLLYITLSTGMGGGFLIDGRIYRGMDGAHPEIGHQAIPYRCSYPERIVCACGAGNCLEALVSGNGIRRIFQKTADQLNDQDWEEVAYNLGQGLRNLATIYLPEAIVLGGGVAVGGGTKLLDTSRQVMEQHLKLVPVPQVRLSRLGYDTALRGAIALAMRGLED
jgi:predicted NBD/HSP70 family sugar kinase